MNAIVLTVALPLLAAFLVPLLARTLPRVAALAGPLILLTGLWLAIDAWQAGIAPQAIAIGGFRPPFGIVFYADSLALLLVALVNLLTLLLWPLRAVDRPREDALFLLLAAAACGLALSGDLFNLYVFYELLSVAAFGLIVAQGTGAAAAATLRYLVISSLGSVLALAGIALVYTRTGSLNLAQLSQLAPEQLADPLGLAAFVLLLVGFGVKAELFPVNAWVPEVYATAGSRVSALLAGLVSKLAVLIVVRLLVLVFNQEAAMQVMLLLGLLGVISGELAAWRATDLRRLLAFSSIGQLGMVFIAFSIPGEAGLLAGLAVALHHLLVKPALFLLAERWGGALERLAGAARVSPLAAAVFTLLVLSLLGVPPLPGFWAKLLLVTGLAEGAQPLYLTALAVVLLATVIEANYLFRLVNRLYAGRDELVPRPAGHGFAELGLATLFATALLAATLAVVPLADGLRGLARQSADVTGYQQTVLPSLTTAEVHP